MKEITVPISVLLMARAALEAGRDQFAEYARHHALKNPPDVEKAETNEAFVGRLELALQTLDEEGVIPALAGCDQPDDTEIASEFGSTPVAVRCSSCMVLPRIDALCSLEEPGDDPASDKDLVPVIYMVTCPSCDVSYCEDGRDAAVLHWNRQHRRFPAIPFAAPGVSAAADRVAAYLAARRGMVLSDDVHTVYSGGNGHSLSLYDVKALARAAGRAIPAGPLRRQS